MKATEAYLGYGYCADCGKFAGYDRHNCDRCESLSTKLYEVLDELHRRNRKRKSARFKSSHWMAEDDLTFNLVKALQDGASKWDWGLSNTRREAMAEYKRITKQMREESK